MNILVTGANGQLGNEMRLIASQLKTQKPEFTFLFTDVCEASDEAKAMLRTMASDDVDTSTTILDITNFEAISQLVTQNSIHACVNCAAWTNVDGAENPDKNDLVELLNAKAPENLAIAMKEANGLLVHISTDYVFGGDPYNTPCKEEQKGSPTGVYGLTKLHGEQGIIATNCNYVILRTAWLYSEFGKNFVKTMLNLTSTRPQLKVVFDQVGTPTYAYDLAQAITTILDDYKKEIVNCQLSTVNYSKSGVYHFSNEGVCSWYDFTKMIAEYSGQTGCDIQPCHSEEFPSPVKRPSYSVLDKTKVKQTFGLTIPYWTDSLRKCISNLQAK